MDAALLGGPEGDGQVVVDCGLLDCDRGGVACVAAEDAGVFFFDESLNHAACGPECFSCAVAAGDEELLGGLELGVGDFPVVGDEAVGVGVGLFEQHELGALLLELKCAGVMGVYPGDDGVQRLFVPPSVVAVVGAEAFLLGAGADLDDLEGLGAGEAEVGWLAHFLIFFGLGNPSTFTVPADCPTPSPRGPGRPGGWLV